MEIRDFTCRAGSQVMQRAPDSYLMPCRFPSPCGASSDCLCIKYSSEDPRATCTSYNIIPHGKHPLPPPPPTSLPQSLLNPSICDMLAKNSLYSCCVLCANSHQPCRPYIMMRNLILLHALVREVLHCISFSFLLIDYKDTPPPPPPPSAPPSLSHWIPEDGW